MLTALSANEREWLLQQRPEVQEMVRASCDDIEMVEFNLWACGYKPSLGKSYAQVEEEEDKMHVGWLERLSEQLDAKTTPERQKTIARFLAQEARMDRDLIRLSDNQMVEPTAQRVRVVRERSYADYDAARRRGDEPGMQRAARIYESVVAMSEVELNIIAHIISLQELGKDDEATQMRHELERARTTERTNAQLVAITKRHHVRVRR